ncbi:MAG: hypothetical protein GF334_12435 [Candidatus Altiarchaeales archaeon]|nr:hypothetical protein [Candidatus Altiarchaeales archaeon]
MAYVDAFNARMQQEYPNARWLRIGVPTVDCAGYIKGPFWELMKFFDWTKGVGSEIPFEDMQTVAPNDKANPQKRREA